VNGTGSPLVLDARAAVLLVAACAGSPPPLAASGGPEPRAPAAPTAPLPAASSEPAPPEPTPPACLPPSARRAGRPVAAEPLASGGIAFCIMLELSAHCLEVDLVTGKFRGRAEELAPGLAFVEPPASGKRGSATFASAGGTVDVCAGAGSCAAVRLRPPVPDAWDEVYEPLPALALSDDRVLVVRTERRPSGGLDMLSTSFLDVYSVAGARRVATRRLGSGVVLEPLQALGRQVLLARCDSHCMLELVDPRTLASKPLGVEWFDRREARSEIRGDQPVVALPDGSYAIVDARGAEVVVVAADSGRLVRRIALGAASDLGSGPARSALLEDGRMIVLRAGPHAGTLSIVDLTGEAPPRSFTAPSCDE
jgi:hypothetical protein